MTEQSDPASPATDANPTHIDAMNRLRIISCPDCGILFAMPLETYLLRMEERGNIYCPNGHLSLLRPESERPESLALLQVQMVAEVRQSRHEAAELRNTLARMPRPIDGSVSLDELQRRIKYLVNRASRSAYGRPICVFCESTHARDSGLKQHFKKEHCNEIVNLPALYFDKP